MIKRGVAGVWLGMVLAGCTAATTVPEVAPSEVPAAAAAPPASQVVADCGPAARVQPGDPVVTSLPTKPDLVRNQLLAGVAGDRSGAVYVADSGGNRILRVQVDGTTTTVAGSGAKGNADGLGPSASFDSPMGVAVDPAGNLYVADYGNRLIRKISSSGDVSTLAGSGQNASVDGQGSAASFQQLGDVACDRRGNVYVVDLGAIRKVTADGTVTTVAAHDPKDAQGEGMPVVTGLGVDAADNLYAVGGTSLYRIAPDRTQTRLFRGDAMVDRDGFYFPADVAVTAAGTIYVADSGNQMLHRVDPATGTVTSIAGSQPCGCAAPRCGYAVIDGVGLQAQFGRLGGLTVLSDGSLVVIDGARLRRVTFPGS